MRFSISDQQRHWPYLAPFSDNTSVTDDDDRRRQTSESKTRTKIWSVWLADLKNDVIIV